MNSMGAVNTNMSVKNTGKNEVHFKFQEFELRNTKINKTKQNKKTVKQYSWWAVT